MPMPLKYNTASQVITLGPFLDDTDGKTPETGLTIANTDIKLWKHGATSLASKNSGGATHIANGIYYCTLDATDTNTKGNLVIYVSVSGALPVRHECFVYDAVVYDSLFGNDKLQVDVQEISGSTVNTSSAQIGVNVVNWKGSTAPAMTGDAYAVVSNATYGNNALKTELDTISGYVDELESRLTATRAGYLDNLTNLDAAVSTRLAASAYTAPDNTGIDAIEAVAAKLDTAMEADGAVYRFTANALELAPSGGSTPAQIADAVWDELLSEHTGTGSAGAALAAAGSAGDPWSTPLPGSYGSGTAGYIVGNNLNAAVSSRLASADYTAPDNTGIAAIKAKTDNLPASPAAVGSQMDLVDAPNATAVTAIQSGLSTLSAGDVADAVWDESTTSHTSSGTFGRLLNLLRRLLFNRQVDSGNSVENFDDDGETSLGTASWSESTGTRGKHTVAW